MFIWIYRLLFLPLSLLSLPGYLLHIRKRGGYGHRFGTRFGKGLEVPARRAGVKRVWVQAVSLGEMLAIEPLLKELAGDESVEVYLTVTTSTGYQLAQEKYGELAIGISYFPLDFPLWSGRVWNAVQPDVAVCAETELWPEHMEQARRRGVPFLLVNGRLSDRSFRRARQLRWLFRGFMDRLTFVYAGSEGDAKRFAELGVAADRIAVTGNIKVDVAIEPRLTAEEKSSRRAELGLGEGFVLLGSSTWDGEEAMLLEAFERLRERDARARLLIVPRHAERRGEIEALLKERAGKFRWWLKSRGMPEGELDILVADTHGELRMLTQLADLAFVGKSLPPHTEGQTPVECGALGTPMVFGPGMSNFRAIREGLLGYGAAREVADAEDAVGTILELWEDGAARRKLGEGGLRWHAASRGAVGRTVKGIREWLDRS